MSLPTSWLAWQLVDSAFPVGGFVHSGGLEAAWQLGETRARGLAGWLEDAVAHQATSQLPFAAAAYDEPEGLVAIDHACDARLLVTEANRASRAQGAALLGAAAAAFASPDLAALRAQARRHGWPCHWAPMFGGVARRIGLERGETLRLLAFGHARSLVSAAVRLGALGPLEAQGVQRRLADVGEAAVVRAEAMPADEAHGSAPLVDLLQASHGKLYSRLFSS